MEPIKQAVEVSLLQTILAEAEAGKNPKVEYRANEDRMMLEDAYELRGQKLSEIVRHLRNILG